MEVARYAPPYFASSSFAWSPFDLFFPLSSSFPSSFELNICQHPIKNLKEPVYLIIFERRVRLYFFSVRISIHQIYNLTIVGYTLEVLVWWDYIYSVLCNYIFILIKQHHYLPPKSRSPSPSLCARDFMWAAGIWVHLIQKMKCLIEMRNWGNICV